MGQVPRIYSRLGATAREQSHEWGFPGGAVVKFAGMELESDAYSWQGSEIALLAFDELAQFSESQFFFMLSRNRSMCGVRPYVRATTNPDCDSWLREFLRWWISDDTGLPIIERSGILRWFVRVDDTIHWGDSRQALVEQFGSDCEPKSVTFIPANVRDNRILLDRDPGYVANLKALAAVDRERLLNGNWNVRNEAGSFFRREWFGIVDTPPADVVARCRFWDRAASEKRPGTNPDATVGVLVSKTRQGVYVIEDCVKMWASPHTVEKAMQRCAILDGIATSIGFMQDPGSAGVSEAQQAARSLDGFSVKFSPATGNKEVRAKPVSAQAEAGNVKIVRAPWNTEFLRVLESFPAGAHDDEVDALSGAHGMLVQRGGGLTPADIWTGPPVGDERLRGWKPMVYRPNWRNS